MEEDEEKIHGQFVNRGQIKLEGGLDYDTAEKIANYHWDIFGSYGKDERGVWNFKTRGDRWCCSVGLLNGKPAILSVTTTPGRLNLLVGNEAYPQLEEITTSAAAGPYSIPGAFSGGNLEKDLKHIEVLGYTLTPQGRADMKRKGDKLYENTEPQKTKPCQNCGHPMPSDKSRCEKCKRLQDDTPDEKKLKYGAAQLQEGKGCPSCNMRVINGVPTHEEGCSSDKSQRNRKTSSCPHCGGTVRGHQCLSCNRRVAENQGLGSDFDRAQRQYDTQLPPKGDGLECPECGGTNGYYTQKERSGRYFVWNAECPDCHAQWGDDNLDTD